MSAQSAETMLLSHLSHLGAGAASEWLRGALADVRATAAAGGDALERHVSAAGRRLGRDAVAAGVDVRLSGDGRALVADRWGADEWGRALLLRAALDAIDDGHHVARVEALFRTGALREQQAIARCLAYLPRPARFVAIGIEAARSNAAAVNEAIACRNPFPAEHFSDAAFNQLVVKCLFIGLPLGEVVGLERRRSPELARMVAAYASERRAAGRAVPSDVALLP